MKSCHSIYVLWPNLDTAKAPVHPRFVKRQFHGQGRMRWNCGDGLVDEYNGPMAACGSRGFGLVMVPNHPVMAMT